MSASPIRPSVPPTAATSPRKVLVVLKEYTGPADPGDPTQPSTFKIARETLVTAQRLLLDTRLNMFHQSIGSLTLLDDYRRWRDRVFLDELAKAETHGAASDDPVVTTSPSAKTKDADGRRSYTTAESDARRRVLRCVPTS